jgi:competence protein ComEA
VSDPRPSLVSLVQRLDVRPAEVAALTLLAAGALAAVALLWWLQRPEMVPAAHLPTSEATATADDAGGLEVSAGEVIVHVAGAVRQPGVYTLPGGSRVGEAVAAAGGETRKAVLDGLNLARVLVDGEQVVVPDRRAQAAGADGDTSAAGDDAQGAKVSLNQATAADFETLPGIGPVLASRIVQHRDSVGGFKEVGQLRDVPGIGEKTFQALAELVSL